MGSILTTLSPPGDGWRKRHDALKHSIYKDIRQHGLPTTCEVFGLFAPLLPQPGRDEASKIPQRKRQGLVPDFMIGLPDGGDVLAELKVMSAVPSRYTIGNVARCRAAAERARAIPAEYAAKALVIDRRFCGTPEGTTGPVSHKFAGYGRI